ncbi:MAG: hypothetical protein WBE28_05880 [bacterium]
MAGRKVAIFIVNFNMPERADALAEHVKNNVKWPYKLFLIDNGSDQCAPAENTNVFLLENVQTTGGWLAGLKEADRQGEDWFAYWFLITSAEFTDFRGDPLAPMVSWLMNKTDAVGVHPALTEDSTTAWKHLIARDHKLAIRRTWMIDNIASLWRADWFDENGRFDPELKYAWGIDLETCFKARTQGRSLWVDERVWVKKVTNIGYDMGRMNMSASNREQLAGQNMADVLSGRYGDAWWDRMLNEKVNDAWR